MKLDEIGAASFDSEISGEKLHGASLFPFSLDF